MTTLYRPVGVHELALIWDSGMRGFPPRLPEQPIFYPVANAEYARQIAAEWNTKSTGLSGFVTSFDVSSDWLSNFEPQVVGAKRHVEYWIPAEKLPEFNSALESLISVEEAYFGLGFQGIVPDSCMLQGMNAVEQFVYLAMMLRKSRTDFMGEINSNRKAVYVNSMFWTQHDFAHRGIDANCKQSLIESVRDAWEINQIVVPLPNALLDEHAAGP